MNRLGTLRGWAAVWDYGQPTPTARRKGEPTPGVYAVELSGGVCKIGCSADPLTRAVEVANHLEAYGQRMPLRLAVSRGCYNQFEVEKALHQRFREHRAKRELFRVSLEDVGNAIPALRFETDPSAKRQSKGDRHVAAMVLECRVIEEHRERRRYEQERQDLRDLFGPIREMEFHQFLIDRGVTGMGLVYAKRAVRFGHDDPQMEDAARAFAELHAMRKITETDSRGSDECVAVCQFVGNIVRATILSADQPRPVP